jgi:hypothetical protein
MSNQKKAPQFRGAFKSTFIDHARESSETPKLNAFCLVAPTVRFKVLAILAACALLRANVFKVRTSPADHDRRLIALFDIKLSPGL